MKLYTLVTLALFAAGCNGIADNPVGPTLVQPTFPTAPTPAPPSGPHFALEIQGSTRIDDSEPWSGFVAVLANPSIVRPEFPVRVVTTCGSIVQAHALGSGSARVSCVLPIGVHVISAVAEMGDGRRFPTALGVTVSRVILPPLQIFFDLFESRAGEGNVMIFSVRTVDGAMSYRWAFGDGESATTLLPNVKHQYDHGSEERRVTVSAVDSNGVTLTSGLVVGRW